MSASMAARDELHDLSECIIAREIAIHLDKEPVAKRFDAQIRSRTARLVAERTALRAVAEAARELVNSAGNLTRHDMVTVSCNHCNATAQALAALDAVARETGG